ncbi:MAG: T9SS type A sorting domain-containing protein [Bacteroidota bacterium]
MKHMLQKKRILLILMIKVLLFQAAWSQGTLPQVKLDLNMNGRPVNEVEATGFTPWIVKSPSDSMVVNGIKFILKKGPRGLSISPTYYKAGIQDALLPEERRFTQDGIWVKDGDFALGSSIILTIKNLPAGTHTLFSYMNILDNVTAANVCPVDVHVNGVRVIDNIVPTVRKVKIADCQSADVQFTVVDNGEVEILFQADTTGTQATKSLFLNGFMLNVAKATFRARSPTPFHNDEHVNVPMGGIGRLSWESSNYAKSHNVFFGTDSLAVTTATTVSPEFKGNKLLADTNYMTGPLSTKLKYYWRIDEVTAVSPTVDTVYKGETWHFRTRQLAFPGAEGYGRFARGGRGGKVVEVTNLNDAGPGSLRHAITNDVGPRTIVFAVSGIIALNSRLVLSQPYVTIAGQTAPGKGIVIRKAPLGITGNDCIVRNVRVRLGGGPTYDGMGLTGANHSIIDHCSISWTIDEAFSSRGGKNSTLQRTLISEALNAAGHANYPAGTEHGYAATIGGDTASFHHNLLAHNYGRNWSLGGGLDGNGFYAGCLDITNNVVYNWGNRTTDGGAREVNFVNNYYKPGAGSKNYIAFTMQHEGTGKGMQRAYFSGNVMPGYFNEANQSAGYLSKNSNGDTSSYQTFVNTPFFPSYVTTQTAYNAYKNVLSDVGCLQPVFDDHDIRITNETLNKTYAYVGSVTGKPGFPDNESDVGGYESYPFDQRAANWDTDHDGMPDWWETLKGFDPNSGADDFSQGNADPDNDGISNLEDYLNWMAEPHASAAAGQNIEVNLKNLSRGFTASPTFTVQSAVNGSVSQTNGNAVFVPTASGFGSFSFTVTDSEGGTMTRTVNTLSLIDLAPLPVSILSFDATRRDASNVLLKWTTSQEVNNDRFEIQKSYTGGNDFKKIADIITKAPGGNSILPLTYEVTDVETAKSDVYYRLVQKDRSGVITLSGIRMVKGTGKSGVAIKIWPTPNDGHFSVRTENLAGNGFIRLTDMSGHILLVAKVKDATNLPVNVSASGTYLLTLTDDAGIALTAAKKVVVNIR